MIFTSTTDLYFITLAFYAYNVIWSIIVDTGLIYLPFIIVIVGTIRDGAESSKNFSDSGFMLKRLETKVYPMLIAVALCGAPITGFDISDTAQFTKICEADSSKRLIEKPFDDSKDVIESERLNGNLKLSSKGVLLELSGQQIELPVLLKFVLVYGTGFVVEAVDNLPCGVNISAVSDQFSNTQIPDQGLKIEYREFIKQCFEPAKQRAFKLGDKGMPWIEKPQAEDQPWPGHDAFMNSAYYGNVGEDFYSKSLIPGFQNAKTNQFVSKWTESKNAETAGLIDCSGGNCLHQQGGFPSCYEWWAGVGAGYPGSSVNDDMSLRQRLWDNLEKEDKDVSYKVIARMYLDMSPDQINSEIFRGAYYNTNVMQQLKEAETKDYSDAGTNTVMSMISRGIGTIGTFSAAIGNFAGASMIQLAAPIAKGMLLLAVIALLPMAFIVGKFDWKFIIPMHFFVGSILFWPFLWELALLAQQSFIEQVMEQGDVGFIDFVQDPNVKILSQYMTDGLFLTFPTIFTSILTAAGMSVGSAMAGAVGSPGKEAGSPARNAGNEVSGKVRGGVEKGAKVLGGALKGGPAGAAASAATSKGKE